MNVKKRIERKFMFSHGEMVKNFTTEEHELMQLTLDNTLKNATRKHPQVGKKTASEKGQMKKVRFEEEANQYISPPSKTKLDLDIMDNIVVGV